MILTKFDLCLNNFIKSGSNYKCECENQFYDQKLQILASSRINSTQHQLIMSESILYLHNQL